jgi:hypothetical protein
MKTIDLLILIIYVTLMVYVAYQARENIIDEKKTGIKQLLAGKIVVEPDRVELAKALKEQLEPLNLDEYIEASLGNPLVIDANAFGILSLTLRNESQTYAVLVEWANSTLTNLTGQANSLALVNLATGLTQSPSLVPPREILQESFTIAQQLDDGGLSPLIDPGSLLKRLTDKDKPIDSVVIRLRLVLKLQPVSNYATQGHLLAISCPYRIRLAKPTDLVKR